MIGHLYRYSHPNDPTRFIYVGQGAKRDGAHRRGTRGFGLRFKRYFPGVELPQPIREVVEVENPLELNELETIWMFRYHTWRGYSGGMNIQLPGADDYKNAGRLGGQIAVETGQIQALGRVMGCKARESGHIQALGRVWGKVRGYDIKRIRSLPQTKIAQIKSGHINGRKMADSGKLDDIRKLPQTKIGQRAAGVRQAALNANQGRKNAESGHMASVGRSGVGGRIGGPMSCHRRWHVKRNIVNLDCSLCQQAKAA